MDTVSAFIERLGGTSAVAAALSLTPSTVSSWKASDRVPTWRRPALLAFAAEKSVTVAESVMDGRKPASAAAAAARAA